VAARGISRNGGVILGGGKRGSHAMGCLGRWPGGVSPTPSPLLDRGRYPLTGACLPLRGPRQLRGGVHYHTSHTGWPVPVATAVALRDARSDNRYFVRLTPVSCAMRILLRLSYHARPISIRRETRDTLARYGQRA
jgi:hypothetical protein